MLIQTLSPIIPAIFVMPKSLWRIVTLASIPPISAPVGPLPVPVGVNWTVIGLVTPCMRHVASDEIGVRPTFSTLLLAKLIVGNCTAFKKSGPLRC